MNISDILAIEGIVVRRIPAETVNVYSSGDRFHPDVYTLKNTDTVKQERVLCDKFKKWRLKETRRNLYGGKYLVLIKKDQLSTVRFDLDSCGMGVTPEEAYKDYVIKTKKL